MTISSLDSIHLIWDELISKMNSNPNISDYSMMNGFLAALKPQIISDKSFILSTNNEWAKQYIDSNYKSLLSGELKKIIGHECEIIIVISDIEGSSIKQENKTNTNNVDKEENTYQKDINSGLFSQENIQNADTSQRSQSFSQEKKEVFNNFHNSEHKNKQLNTNTSLKDKYPFGDKHAGSSIQEINKANSDKTFDSFVVADTNSYAYGAAYSVAENPGEINNPLFIYGRSGLGKTHLLLAIKDYVNNNYFNKVVYYTPATNLIEDYVHSLGTKDWVNFNQKYRGADILLLDDVQYLEGAEETTNEFFKIFNEMISAKKHIVLSADRAPKDINLDERLKSRFANGVTADIQAPKFETKLKIFQNHIEHLKEMHQRPNLEIPIDVVNRVVELSNTNIRNLEGAAASLVVYIIYGREDRSEPISVEEAEEITSKIFFTNINEKITISDIQRFVESYFKISHGEMIGSQRPRNISQARQIAMYLSRTLTQASYPDIGKAFKKDHSSVVHAYKNIEKKRQTNRDFFNEIERISDLIVASEEN